MTEGLLDENLDWLKKLLKARYGLDADRTRRPELARAVRRQMRHAHAQSWDEYRQLLEGPEGEKYLDLLIADIAVGETYFFRHPGQFRALAQYVFPWLQLEKKGEHARKLRIWSAGCSTGEEAYSLAWTAAAVCRDWAETIEVVGTDISQRALEQARRARYGLHSLRGLPLGLVERFLVKEASDTFRPVDEARRLVRLECLNLLSSEVERMRNFDVIFCRNVLIYFEQSVRQRVLRSLHRALRDGGYLFLSPTERCDDHSGFATIRAGDVFFHRKLPVDACVGPASEISGQPREDWWAVFRCPGPARSRNWVTDYDSGTARRQPRALPAPTPSPQSRADTISRSRKSSTRRQNRSAAASTESTSVNRSGQEAGHQPDGCDSSAAPAAIWKEALSEFASERQQQAANLVDRLLKLEPQNVRGWLLRALILAGEGADEEAVRCCHHALSLDPCDAESHFVLGMLLDAQGDTDQALDEFQKAVFLDSNFAAAAFRLGCLLQRQGRAAAKRVFRSTLQALEHETNERILLYGGGFTREDLRALCQAYIGQTAPDLKEGSQPPIEHVAVQDSLSP